MTLVPCSYITKSIVTGSGIFCILCHTNCLLHPAIYQIYKLQSTLLSVVLRPKSPQCLIATVMCTANINCVMPLLTLSALSFSSPWKARAELVPRLNHKDSGWLYTLNFVDSSLLFASAALSAYYQVRNKRRWALWALWSAFTTAPLCWFPVREAGWGSELVPWPDPSRWGGQWRSPNVKYKLCSILFGFSCFKIIVLWQQPPHLTHFSFL